MEARAAALKAATNEGLKARAWLLFEKLMKRKFARGDAGNACGKAEEVDVPVVGVAASALQFSKRYAVASPASASSFASLIAVSVNSAALAFGDRY